MMLSSWICEAVARGLRACRWTKARCSIVQLIAFVAPPGQEGDRSGSACGRPIWVKRSCLDFRAWGKFVALLVSWSIGKSAFAREGVASNLLRR
jgi:hypothetical protein